MKNTRQHPGRLSSAQHDALSVLATAGGRVEAGKRRSTPEPRPYVNQRAADSLVRLGLARCVDPDLEQRYPLDSGVPREMVCTYKYEATAEGREVHRTMYSGGSDTRTDDALHSVTPVAATVDPELARLIEKYRQECWDGAMAVAPEEVEGLCSEYANEFAEFLHRHRVRAEVRYLADPSEIGYTDRTRVPTPDEGHAVVVVDSHVIDFSAAQYGYAQFPLVLVDGERIPPSGTGSHRPSGEGE